MVDDFGNILFNFLARNRKPTTKINDCVIFELRTRKICLGDVLAPSTPYANYFRAVYVKEEVISIFELHGILLNFLAGKRKPIKNISI